MASPNPLATVSTPCPTAAIRSCANRNNPLETVSTTSLPNSAVFANSFRKSAKESSSVVSTLANLFLISFPISDGTTLIKLATNEVGSTRLGASLTTLIILSIAVLNCNNLFLTPLLVGKVETVSANPR